MKCEVLYPGAFPMVRVELERGESIKAESGAMVAASPTVDVESKLEGGFLGALSRKLLTGEKFF
ncbi:MAG: AIM24 family protein, partial [Nitrospiraceae bacterium]